MSIPTTKRIHFLVHGGTVQGVFFRAHTVTCAAAHSLTGWVRNLPNGKVEGEAQGPADALEKFLKEVEKGPKGSHVVRLDREEVEVWGEGEGVSGKKQAWEGFRKVRWGEEV